MSKSTITTVESSQVAASESQSLSRAVLDAVAEAEGVDQTELEPLFYAIDPDRLDALFGPQICGTVAPDVSAEIRFPYHGYEVRVNAAGRVNLDEQ